MLNLSEQIALIVFVAIMNIVNVKIVFSQRFGKMTHCAKQKRYLLLMVLNVGGFFTYFRHQNCVFAFYCVSNRWQRLGKLIA